MSCSTLADLTFAAAAGEWLKTRRRISDSSTTLYRSYIAELERFFGAMKLSEIHIGNVEAYQTYRQEQIRASRRHRARLSADAKPQPSDGASRINHEVGCLGQVMARAGLWTEVKRFYEPLPLPKTEGMALSPEEEEHLFNVARRRPRWFVAYCCGILSRNTTAGPGEIRHLRFVDVELDGPQGSFIRIEEGVKNEFRRRPIALNGDGRWAVLQLLDRARRLGGGAPEDFILPHRAHRRGADWDFSRPMGHWKRAHRAMRAEAAKKYPRLALLRIGDYRHTACTDLLEDPTISFTTIEHMMGHRLNSKTKRKYDHLRNTALQSAAAALDRRRRAPQPKQLELPSTPPKQPQSVTSTAPKDATLLNSTVTLRTWFAGTNLLFSKKTS